LAKPNYDFAKRQRELAKKQKKEEKLKRKQLPDGTAAEPAPQPAGSQNEATQATGVGEQPT
jgi:hypothetical protein